MENRNRYSAVCIGGPLHGQRLVREQPHLDVHQEDPRFHTPVSIGGVTFAARIPIIARYTFVGDVEAFAIDDERVKISAWVLDSDLHRQRAFSNRATWLLYLTAKYFLGP